MIERNRERSEAIHAKGKLEVICGSMFSGKTEELIRRLRRQRIAFEFKLNRGEMTQQEYDESIVVIKPSIDNRYNIDKISSHDGMTFDAKLINKDKPEEMLSFITENTKVVAIDEIQFFEQGVVGLLEELADQDKLVIAAGLNLDFRGEPFGPMADLMARIDHVDTLHAICTMCGEEASRTQRIINGKPAAYDDPIVMVGAAESYEARCRHCHEVAPAKK